MGFLEKTLFLVVVAAVFTHSSAQIDAQTIKEKILKNRKLPGIDVCGKTNTTQDKIFGGVKAKPGEFPWMAAIGYEIPLEGLFKWQCGGSLITDQYIVTAAHCLPPALRFWVPKLVRLGGLDLNATVSDGSNHVDFTIEKYIAHEEYSDKTKVSDIGLIKLVGKVNFTDRILPICLPPPEFDQELFMKHNPIIAGWGKTNSSQDSESPYLMRTEIEIQDTKECRANNTSKFILRNAIIDDRQICASAPGKDSCGGDSGGPMMLYRSTNNSGNTFLLGIISFGYKCNVTNYPGVYVRTAKYMEWIVDHLEL